MEFKSRFVRGLPVLALAASLLIPFKPLAAAEGPYTAARPGVSAIPAAQISAADPAADDELDAARKLRQPGHGKKRHLTAANPTAAPDDELDAVAKVRKPRRDKKQLITAADSVAVANNLDGKKDHRRKPRNA